MGNLLISDKAKQVYLSRLIGKLFKILPMFEEKHNLVPKIYVHALIININSANELFDGVLIDIVINLNEIYISSNMNHQELKRLVLGCTNLAEYLKNEVEERIRLEEERAKSQEEATEKMRLEGLVKDGESS